MNAELPNWLSTFSAHAQVNISTVRARGRLDLFTADVLRGAIDVLILSGRYQITLDLAGVVSIDRTGARLLHEVHAALLAKSGSLRVVNVCPGVQAALDEAAAGSSVETVSR